MTKAMMRFTCTLGLVARLDAFAPLTPALSSAHAAARQRGALTSCVRSHDLKCTLGEDSTQGPDGLHRAEFVRRAAAFVLGIPTIQLVGPLAAGAEDRPDFKKVRAAVADLIKEDPNRGPTIVRLAWHASGTYDKMSKTGGSSGGTIRFKEELAHGANAGLAAAVKLLEPIREANPSISYGDLYTLAGVEAIKQLGGPDVKWRAGRKDTLDITLVTADGRLPDADKGSPDKTAKGLRDTFYRMGFNDQEIVALSGAHALGRCHVEASGYEGPWTPTPTTFNNAYYTLLKNVKWTPREWKGPFQYKDGSGTLMMLPSDLVLIEDPGFKKFVDVYASSNQKFYEDFSKAFNKLEELGTSGLYDV